MEKYFRDAKSKRNEREVLDGGKFIVFACIFGR